MQKLTIEVTELEANFFSELLNTVMINYMENKLIDSPRQAAIKRCRKMIEGKFSKTLEEYAKQNLKIKTLNKANATSGNHFFDLTHLQKSPKNDL